jgi:hypothetical protein
MQPDDRIRVLHMIEAAEAVEAFVGGRHRADLDVDRMLLFALVRAVEIIGEAASGVSPESRATAHAAMGPDHRHGQPVDPRLLRYRPRYPVANGSRGSPLPSAFAPSPGDEPMAATDPTA